jgi:hypothetical protein
MTTYLIRIYHATDGAFRDTICGERVEHHIANGHYGYAGSLEIEADSAKAACEIAYSRSQNVDRPWRPALPCRSTSVGDVMRAWVPNAQRTDGYTAGRWVVDRIGMREVNEAEVTREIEIRDAR